MPPHPPLLVPPHARFFRIHTSFVVYDVVKNQEAAKAATPLPEIRQNAQPHPTEATGSPGDAAAAAAAATTAQKSPQSYSDSVYDRKPSPAATENFSPQTAVAAAATAADGGAAAAAAGGVGEGLGEDDALLRDWDRGADGQVEALRQGVERLSVPSAGGPEGHGQAQGGAGAAGNSASDEIELFVEADGIAEEGEGPTKEDKDLLKHRVWFWQVRPCSAAGTRVIHPILAEGRQLLCSLHWSYRIPSRTLHKKLLGVDAAGVLGSPVLRLTFVFWLCCVLRSIFRRLVLRQSSLGQLASTIIIPMVSGRTATIAQGLCVAPFETTTTSSII